MWNKEYINNLLQIVIISFFLYNIWYITDFDYELPFIAFNLTNAGMDGLQYLKYTI